MVAADLGVVGGGRGLLNVLTGLRHLKRQTGGQGREDCQKQHKLGTNGHRQGTNPTQTQHKQHTNATQTPHKRHTKHQTKHREEEAGTPRAPAAERGRKRRRERCKGRERAKGGRRGEQREKGERGVRGESHAA